MFCHFIINKWQRTRTQKSAFVIFSAERRPIIAAADKSLKFSDLTKLVAKQWKALGEEDQKKYEEKSLEDGLDMLSVGCMDCPVAAWKHWGRLKVKILPPKAQTAYTLFRRMKEKEILKDNPSESKQAVKKRVAAEWKGYAFTTNTPKHVWYLRDSFSLLLCSRVRFAKTSEITSC